MDVLYIYMYLASLLFFFFCIIQKGKSKYVAPSFE